MFKLPMVQKCRNRKRKVLSENTRIAVAWKLDA